VILPAFLGLLKPSAGGGGGSPEGIWQSVANTDDTGLVGTGTLDINLPSGGTSDQTMVLVMDGIESGQRARLTPPSGWTFRFEYYNLDGFGATAASGFAIYTAPGNTTANTWSLSAGSTINAGWAVHLCSGLDNSAPIRGTIQVNDSNTWGTPNNMPSPTATPTAGDLVMAHLYHPQSDTAFGTGFNASYTRVVHLPNPGRRSTLVRSNAPGSATGTISHDAAGTFQARVSFTMILAAV
jgi:hypothetical protein